MSNNWIRCADEMPDSDSTVLVHCPDGDEPVWLGYHDGERWRDIDGSVLDDAPTHWMQLPDAPLS